MKSKTKKLLKKRKRREVEYQPDEVEEFFRDEIEKIQQLDE
jgi:hypothetical protein